MADKNPLLSLVDPYAWRSDMNAQGGMPTGGYVPQAMLSAGPEPSAHEAMRNSIYSLLGGRPENAWSADKLAMLADVGTLGIPTSIYDGAREVARGGSSGQLAMAIMPGMKPVGAAAKAVGPAVKEAVQGISRPQLPLTTGRHQIDYNGSRLTYKVGDDGIRLDSIYTVPEARGRGTAKALVNDLVGVADNARSPMSLEISPGAVGVDPARLRAWYESLGFGGPDYNMTRPSTAGK